jgi:hypothetical protein
MKVSLTGGTDMYSESQFREAKYELVYSYFSKPDCTGLEALNAFHRKLFFYAVIHGEITPKNVERAMNAADLSNLSDRTREAVLVSMQDSGRNFIGKLSPEQLRELMMLYDACWLVAQGYMSAIKDVAKLLWK